MFEEEIWQWVNVHGRYSFVNLKHLEERMDDIDSMEEEVNKKRK